MHKGAIVRDRTFVHAVRLNIIMHKGAIVRDRTFVHAVICDEVGT